MFTSLFRPAKARARDAALSLSSQHQDRRDTRAPHSAPESKACPPLIALSLLGRAPSWSSSDYPSLARVGVMQNAIAYRCVRMIAEAAASLPWLLYEGAEEIEEHPLLELFKTPNPGESGVALFERWYAYLQCAGNSYLQLTTLEGAPRELYVLRPDRVSVVTDANGWVRGFDYTVSGRTTRLSRDANGFLPILQMRLFHPLDEVYGYSPVAAALRAVEIHNAGACWTKSLLDNAARPSGALIYKGPDGAPGLSDEQFTRLKHEMENAYTGAANAGRPMVLEGGLDWRAMSFTPNDMDFASIRDAAAREIALAFGVPPMLLGIPGDNTYSNYREANLAFWRATVIPLVTRAADALTGWLARRYSDTLKVGFDLDSIPALAADREATWDKLNAASFLTLNEKRSAAGYSPVEGGDVLG
jgi:HK97 family phage portal protein